MRLRDAGIRVCLATGFSPSTRDAIIDELAWGGLIDLALSPADAGRGRPWPDLPLTALLMLAAVPSASSRWPATPPATSNPGCAPGPRSWRAC